MDLELEDSVQSLQAPADVEEEVVKPRKLGRLRKAGAVENAQPNRAAAPASPGQLGRNAAQATSDGDLTAPRRPAAPEEEAVVAGDTAAAPSGCQEKPDIADDDAAQLEEGEEEEEGKEHSFYDEEDELEERFVRRATQGADGAAASAEASEDEDEGPAGSELSGDSGRSGSPGTMELLATDTQRILRETAARDRLGKGHKIEIQPLSSILGRIKERQALAIARAPKPALPDVGSFEEILAEARQQAGEAAAIPVAAAADMAGHVQRQAAGDEHPGGAPAAAGEEGAAATAAALQAAEVAEAAVGGDGVAGGMGEDGDDLLILGSDEEGGAEVRLVELPSTGKKKPRMPFITQENSYEDEVLIDDGYNSEEEDLEEEDDGDEEGSELAADDSSEAEDADGGEGQEGEQGSGKAAVAGRDSPAGSSEASVGGQEGVARRQGSAEPPAGDDEQQDEAMEEDAEPSGASGDAAAAALAGPAVPKRVKKLQRMFLDMEAELSDEEEGGGHSEDESEDLDDQGELAGLIGAAKETARDGRLRQQLHRQWAEQQDDKELQQLMAGLKNGFRRRRGGGFFDEEDDELAGRRRRARADGDEDEPATDGGLAWPSPFDEPAGSDDEAEDEELLRKAKEGLLLADSGEGLEGGGGSGAGGSAGGLSAGGSGSGDGGIPLDEGSQEVLGLLLARSASEPQQGSGGAGGGAGRSRFAPAGVAAALPPLFGSDPSNSRLPGLPGLGSQSRGPSFVGRQPTAVRGASSSNLGAGSRSFVFGRDDSQSALPADKGGSGEGGAGSAPDAGSQGPTSFANLRQLAGMPGTSATAGQQQQQRKRAGSSLVSRLKPPAHRAGKEPVGSQPANPASSAAAAAAAVAVMAGGGRRAK